MRRGDYVILFVIGLLVPLGIAQFQSLPGYMDADYYYGGGVQLAQGKGFNEPYLWNYLDDPQGLPHPSHTYWMPLASLLAAAALGLSGGTSYAAARLGFILLAGLIPPLTARLGWRVTNQRALGISAGLLACFPIYYAPFLPVTDNYAIYMLLGIAYFLLFSALIEAKRNPNLIFLGFGLTAGAMTLARSDGLLWLGISLLVAIWQARRTGEKVVPGVLRFSAFSVLGFLLLMSAWYARNLSVFGSLMAPGGSRALWLTSYNDTFAYPAAQVNLQTWLDSGAGAILAARFKALGMNLLNAMAAQGGILLFPFILIGIWKTRQDPRVRLAVLAWALLLAAMTLVFPFAGPRGAFFHAGAALQPMWWVMAPLGLDALVAGVRRRGWLDARAFVIFRGALVVIAILMTGVIFATRVLPGWEREDGLYANVGSFLSEQGADPQAVVIVRNPPGFNIVTDHPAIALSTSGTPAILECAARYGARYLVLEPDGTPDALEELFENPDSNPGFRYLGEIDGIRIYEILD